MAFKVITDEAEVPDQMVDGKPTLVYWNIVGLAMPIRLALAYAGVDFVDVRIEIGDPAGDSFNKAYPPSKKGKLSNIMPFPNLPYFLDGDVAIAQTNAILRFIARKYGIVSSKEHKTDYLCDHITDIESTLAKMMYVDGVDALVAWYKTVAPRMLETFSRLLQESGTPFLAGETPAIDDFKLFAILFKIVAIQDDLGSDETKGFTSDALLEYMKRFEALPKIKEYLSSNDHLSTPLNNVIAKWNK